MRGVFHHQLAHRAVTRTDFSGDDADIGGHAIKFSHQRRQTIGGEMQPSAILVHGRGDLISGPTCGASCLFDRATRVTRRMGRSPDLVDHCRYASTGVSSIGNRRFNSNSVLLNHRGSLGCQGLYPIQALA